MYVGVKQGERLVTLKEVAEAYQISANHLRKIVHRLALSGILESRQGRNGGILLGHPAEQIRIGDVIRLMEQREEPIDCEARECVLLASCALRGQLRLAISAFYDSLNQVTLADMLGTSGMYEQLVSIRPAE